MLASSCYALAVSRILTVRVHDALLSALEAEARRVNRPKGHIVRQALEARLAPARGRALQRLAKYTGVIDGPRDLSTDKRHLASLGRRRRRVR